MLYYWRKYFFLVSVLDSVDSRFERDRYKWNSVQSIVLMTCLIYVEIEHCNYKPVFHYLEIFLELWIFRESYLTLRCLR